jgi:hypothetical protein
LRLQLFRVLDHRPKLVHPKAATIPACARLYEEDRTARVDRDRDRTRDEDDDDEREQEQTHRQVE